MNVLPFAIRYWRINFFNYVTYVSIIFIGQWPCVTLADISQAQTICHGSLARAVNLWGRYWCLNIYYDNYNYMFIILSWAFGSEWDVRAIYIAGHTAVFRAIFMWLKGGSMNANHLTHCVILDMDRSYSRIQIFCESKWFDTLCPFQESKGSTQCSAPTCQILSKHLQVCAQHWLRLFPECHSTPAWCHRESEESSLRVRSTSWSFFHHVLEASSYCYVCNIRKTADYKLIMIIIMNISLTALGFHPYQRQSPF
jgi:hypothetical protein